MTPAVSAPAPLEANDIQRARALKAKIGDRVSDVRRHLLALRTAMAEFGDDFELDAFRVAYSSEDPVELNRVKAVERVLISSTTTSPSSLPLGWSSPSFVGGVTRPTQDAISMRCGAPV
jgi:hypothetical protein